MKVGTLNPVSDYKALITKKNANFVEGELYYCSYNNYYYCLSGISQFFILMSILCYSLSAAASSGSGFGEGVLWQHSLWKGYGLCHGTQGTDNQGLGTCDPWWLPQNQTYTVRSILVGAIYRGSIFVNSCGYRQFVLSSLTGL